MKKKMKIWDRILVIALLISSLLNLCWSVYFIFNGTPLQVAAYLALSIALRHEAYQVMEEHK